MVSLPGVIYSWKTMGIGKWLNPENRHTRFLPKLAEALPHVEEMIKNPVLFKRRPVLSQLKSRTFPTYT
jgi:hypothetical protein